jgi:hypothetical protein
LVPSLWAGGEAAHPDREEVLKQIAHFMVARKQRKRDRKGSGTRYTL